MLQYHTELLSNPHNVRIKSRKEDGVAWPVAVLCLRVRNGSQRAADDTLLLLSWFKLCLHIYSLEIKTLVSVSCGEVFICWWETQAQRPLELLWGCCLSLQQTILQISALGKQGLMHGQHFTVRVVYLWLSLGMCGKSLRTSNHNKETDVLLYVLFWAMWWWKDEKRCGKLLLLLNANSSHAE